MSITRKCTIDGCERQYIAKGMCDKHYKRAELLKKPLYQTWLSMKARCYNPNKRDYAYYGGRGIKVCNRWVNDYKTFEKDMGPKPSPSHSIDRIDVNGDYEPSNCKWASNIEQANNQRLRKDNTSGHIGISFNKRDGLWTAYNMHYNIQTIIGNFKSREDALSAYHLFVTVCKQCDK